MQSIQARTGLSVAAMLVLCGSIPGQRQTAPSPQAVVEKYCTLDAKGATFSSPNPDTQALWRLLINEDEAAYDQAVITQSHRLGKSTINAAIADVEVIYADLGTLSGDTAKKNQRSETVIFHLGKVGDAWKIDGLRIFPHVSQTWILSDLRRNLAANEKAGKREPQLAAAIAQISGW